MEKRNWGYWTKEKCFAEAKKYRKVSEFYKNSCGAYVSAKTHGWIDEYTWLEKCDRKPRGYWTYERCYEEAKNCSTRKEFETLNGVAYNVSSKNGWLDEWFGKNTKKPMGYWDNYDNCKKEALKYKTRGEFSKTNTGAYLRALQHGWLDEWFGEDTAQKPSGYWDYDHCYEEAKKYNSRTEFMTKASGAYSKAKDNGWLNDYDWFSVREVKPRDYWTYERCYEEAKKYNTRNELQKKSKSAYDAAKRNGWIDEYTWLKKRVYDGIDYWIYSYEDEENKVAYVGLTHRKYRHNEHKSAKNNDIVYRYFKGNVPDQRVLMDGLNGEEAQYYEDWYKMAYVRMGWKVLNKGATGVGKSSLGSAPAKWNYDTCYEEAKKHRTITEFKKASGRAYEVAKENGWIVDYVWFEKSVIPRGYWSNYDHCYEEAKKYETRNEFYKKSKGAYDAAKMNGWLDKFDWLEEQCKPQNYWTKERCIEAVRNCKTRSEFIEKYSGAYMSMRRNGWENEIVLPDKIITRQNRRKPVLQYDMSMNFIKKYDAVQDIPFSKTRRGNIIACCKGRRNYAYGYIWKYEKAA